MTAQSGEILFYQGEELSMQTCPLQVYFNIMDIHPGFTREMSCNWRGYNGTWEILDNHLYLVKLIGKLNNDTFASIESFFPNYPNRVFANWFSGFITIAQGELLEYVHTGFCSTYERSLILDVVRGKVVSTQQIENRDNFKEKKRFKRENQIVRDGGMQA